MLFCFFIVPTRGNILLFINNSISSLQHQDKSVCSVPLRNTSKNSAESGEQSVWTLGPLCLPWCVRYKVTHRFIIVDYTVSIGRLSVLPVVAVAALLGAAGLRRRYYRGLSRLEDETIIIVIF